MRLGAMTSLSRGDSATRRARPRPEPLLQGRPRVDGSYALTRQETRLPWSEHMLQRTERPREKRKQRTGHSNADCERETDEIHFGFSAKVRRSSRDALRTVTASSISVPWRTDLSLAARFARPDSGWSRLQRAPRTGSRYTWSACGQRTTLPSARRRPVDRYRRLLGAPATSRGRQRLAGGVSSSG
jgi:hypothetical protein